MIEFLARNGRQFVAADVDATIDHDGQDRRQPG
jgi:hypothetical protein